MNFKNILLLLVLLTLNTACLKTRGEVDDEDKIVQSQVNQLQRSKADQEANLQNYEGQIRTLNGRIETLEHQVTQLSTDKEELYRKLNENDSRFKQLEQALLQVEQGQTVVLKPTTPARSNDETPATKKDSKKRTTFDDAEEFFAQKEWKKAVVLYQKYRDKNPNGSDIAAATYKMGVCFQEMKMNKESRVFYDEVVEKHGKSKFAKMAQTRLSQMKKK